MECIFSESSQPLTYSFSGSKFIFLSNVLVNQKGHRVLALLNLYISEVLPRREVIVNNIILFCNHKQLP